MRVARFVTLLSVGLGLAGACATPKVPEAPHDAGALVDASDADASDADANDADANDADASDADASDALPRRAAFAAQGSCPDGMAEIEPHVCMDRWEASIVVMSPEGRLVPNPPNRTPDDTEDFRAVSQPGVFPQTYVSAHQAEDACSAAGKRLCSHAEWMTACEGSRKLAYPYGERRAAGTCNDDGRSPIAVVFPGALLPTHAHGATTAPAAAKGAKSQGKTKAGKGPRGTKKGAPSTKKGGKKGRGKKGTSGPTPGVDPSVWTKLNDPRLGEVSGTFTRSGERAMCHNELDVFDLVGNAHEWVSDELPNGNGMFAGGYFQDVQINGEGCHYRTTAHARTYRDYSIGFRCCLDAPE